MSDQPSTYELDNNQYERPNQDWTCGRAAEGLPCPGGPSKEGKCGAICTPVLAYGRYHCTNSSKFSGNCDDGPLPDGSCCTEPAQCTPSKVIDPVTKETRWICTRGQCLEGPLPDGSCCGTFIGCRPVRTIQARRRRVTWTVVSLAVGVLLLMVADPGDLKPISPGPLSGPHASLIDRCQHCHQIGSGRLDKMIQSALMPSSTEDQSSRCLACHEELGEFALNPHGISPDALGRVTAAAGGTPVHRQLACANCHQEHRGSSFDLKAMTDQQCQSCHVNTFHDFATGHPEFHQYPYERRTRIYFNHQTHYGVHFANYDRTVPGGEFAVDPPQDLSMTSKTCMQCHQLSGDGHSIVTLPFEQTCATCHEHQVVDQRLALGLISVPIELWNPPSQPDQASSQVDAGLLDQLSPLVQLLLETDPEYVEARDTIVQSTASGQDAVEIRNAARDQLSSSVHQLFDELEDQGAPALGRRLEQAVDRQIQQPDLVRLVKTFPFDLIKRANTIRKSAGQANATPESLAGDSMYAPISTGQWRLGASTDALSIEYTPKQHTDLLLTAWIDMTAKQLDASSLLGAQADQRDGKLIRSLFDQLVAPTQAGRCMKCHTVDRDEDRSLKVNWMAARPSSAAHGIHRFSHLPHVRRMHGNERCLSCHQMTGDNDFFLPHYLQRDLSPHAEMAHPLSSGFHPITKSNCSQCHHQEGERQSCTTCHNYHVYHRHDQLPGRLFGERTHP